MTSCVICQDCFYNMPLEVLSIFFVTAALLGLTPGPDNLFVLTQSLAYGSRAGVLVVLGLCTGLLFHTALVASGLAAIIAASSQLLLVIKLLGVGYLIYLALKSWQAGAKVEKASKAIKLTGFQLYRRGIIMNISNPKVGLFFLAFLPQFVNKAYGSVVPQVLILGMLFAFSTVLVFGGIALLAGIYSEGLNSSTTSRILLNRSISIIFLVLAVNLVWNMAYG